jgi:cell division septum initiation protein DivIVA
MTDIVVDEIERLRLIKADWRAAMTENHDLWREIERLREEIQQLKHDSTIFIKERSDAICENFDLREENAELRATAIAMLKEEENTND